MVSSTLSTLFGSQYRAKVLECLYLNPSEVFHLRGISRKTGVPPASLHTLLRKLSSCGLINTVNLSGKKLYQANFGLSGAEELSRLIRLQSIPVFKFQFVVDSIPNVGLACIFGSRASGSARSDSDFDVLIIGELSGIKAQAVFKELGRELNIQIDVMVLTKSEARRQAKIPDSFLSDVLSKPTIALKGDFSDLKKTVYVASL